MPQLEEKDIPILEHLVDLQHINLRDEEPSTSTKSEDSEDEDDEKPKVHFVGDLSPAVHSSSVVQLEVSVPHTAVSVTA